MTWYVGLTDNPERRKTEHGNPKDWGQTQFALEADARAWEKKYVGQQGYQGGPGGAGWRYRYWYSITSQTVQ